MGWHNLTLVTKEHQELKERVSPGAYCTKHTHSFFQKDMLTTIHMEKKINIINYRGNRNLKVCFDNSHSLECPLSNK